MNQHTNLRNISIRIENNISRIVRPRINSGNDPDDFAFVNKEFELACEEYKNDGTNYESVTPFSRIDDATQDANSLQLAYSVAETSQPSYTLLTPVSRIETTAEDLNFLEDAFSRVETSYEVLTPVSETGVTAQGTNSSEENYSPVETSYELLTPVSETESTIEDADSSQRAYSSIETSYESLTVVGKEEIGTQNVRSTQEIAVSQTDGISNSKKDKCLPCTSLTVKQEDGNQVNEVVKFEYQAGSSLQRETVPYSTTILSNELDNCVLDARLIIKRENPCEETNRKVYVSRCKPLDASSSQGEVVSHSIGISNSGLGNHMPYVRSAINQKEQIVKVMEVKTLNAKTQEKVDSYSVESNNDLVSYASCVRLAVKEENLDENINEITEIQSEDAKSQLRKNVPLSNSVSSNGTYSCVPCHYNTIKLNLDGQREDEDSLQEKLVLNPGSSYVPHSTTVINKKLDEERMISSQDKICNTLSSGRNECVPKPKFTVEPKLVNPENIESKDTRNTPLTIENLSSQEGSVSDELASTKVIITNNKTDANKSSQICKTSTLESDEIRRSKMPIAFLYEPNTVLDIANIPFNLTSSNGLLRDVVVVMPESVIPIINNNNRPESSIPVSDVPKISIPIVNDTVVSKASDTLMSVVSNDVISNVPDNSTSLVPVDEWTMCSGCSSPFHSPPPSKKLKIFRSDEPPGICKHCCARLKRANYLYSHMNKITCRGIWSSSSKKIKR